MAAPSSRRPHVAAFAVLAVAGLLAVALPSLGNREGVVPPQGCTCHNDNPNTAVEVHLDGWPVEYTPGQLYPLTVTGSGDVPGAQGGFSAEVNKGSLSSTDPLVTAAGRFATHSDSGERAWPVVWLAPPEDSGGVTLTVYVNLVNGDGSEGVEDHWNVASFSAVEKAPEPPKPSTLALAFEAANGTPTAGHNFSAVATLRNSTDAPIANALVTFLAHLRFGILPIASNRTDANGTARVNYSVVADGQFLVLAHYDGSAKNISSDANATVTVGDPDHLFDTYYGRPQVRQGGIFDPVRLPLGLIVGGVWLTFAYAALEVLRIRKAGEPSNDGPRDLLKLLVPQFGRIRRKKP